MVSASYQSKHQMFFIVFPPAGSVLSVSLENNKVCTIFFICNKNLDISLIPVINTKNFLRSRHKTKHPCKNQTQNPHWLNSQHII